MEDLKEWSENIKNSLSIEQVAEIVATFGGDPQIKNEIIVCRTICHGGNSHKLYYYDNTKLFKCYTDCPEASFDIFQLIIKINKINKAEVSLSQAINFIEDFFNIKNLKEDFFKNDKSIEDWKILNKYYENKNKIKEQKRVELKVYDKKVINNLVYPEITPWLKEGISQEVLSYCRIAFNPSSWGIVIPHFNIDNELIGIRERTLIKEEESKGKYKPAIINRQMYNHPLGFNLYGINWAKDNIKKMKKAIIFEGEKSVLKFMSFFGIDNSIALATCGSSLTSYQVELLKKLGVEEIIIAFDRQFKELGDEEWKNWTKKLKDIDKKYRTIVNVSFMFDKENLLGYKDSPIDKGKEIFLKLYKGRIILNG